MTVAVATYNGRHLLESMLPTLASQSFREFEVVIVDDCSTDGTVTWLREHWPGARIVAHDRNRGVTATMNSCLRAARTELVALLNNDIELDRDCLRELIAALDAHPEAGSAAPKMLDATQRTLLDGAGDLLSWRGGGGRRGHGQPDTGQYERAEEIFGPCGGAALLRRAAIESVGKFDEAYFAYYEDLDWAFRAQLAGFSCRYVPTAVLYHRGSATLGRGLTDFNCYHLWRNPIWLVAKCYPAGTLARHLPELVRGQLGNLYVAVRERKLRVWARAIGDAVRGLPVALRKRRAVQRTRVVTLGELDAAVRAGRR